MSSTNNHNSTPDYTMGYGRDYIDFLLQAPENELNVLLQPFLAPGQCVLDLGCGPGHISIALARSVVPGEMYGVDMEPSQVELAQLLAAEHGVINATFEVADATLMPYDDGYFDIVNCCDILAYIPDTAAALSEARRVLKPGGILHCREMIIGSSFVFPENKDLNRGWEIFSELLQADDGHPQIGKELQFHLEKAGFTNLQVSPTFETYSGSEGVDAFYRLVKGWFLSDEMTKAAKTYGTAIEEDFNRLVKSLEDWRNQPGAIASIAFGRVLGFA
ncbi:MAG: methyltransferase domain-containing protein [Chloroflexi bacterium]|nr:methyltransferase domain-containing protein [Chloroflexota bacterium]